MKRIVIEDLARKNKVITERRDSRSKRLRPSSGVDAVHIAG
jgi:hypothetical protein